jgi:hypothetical protein
MSYNSFTVWLSQNQFRRARHFVFRKTKNIVETYRRAGGVVAKVSKSE